MLQLPMVELLQLPLVDQRKGTLVGKGKGQRTGGPQVPVRNRVTRVLPLDMMKYRQEEKVIFTQCIVMLHNFYAYRCIL